MKRIALALLASVPICVAQSWQPLPEGGEPLFPPDPIAALRLNTNGGGVASASVVDVNGMPFTRAYRVTVTTPGSTAWSVQIMGSTAGAIQAGDVLLMSMWVRGSAEIDETGEARGTAYLQLNTSPNTKYATLGFTAGPEWRQLLLPFQASVSLGASAHGFVLHMGTFQQQIDVGGLSIVNYKTSVRISDLPRTLVTYHGRDPGAAWRAEAGERIEKHRKAPLSVKVIDTSGRPIVGAEVRVRQTRHAFGFGSAVTAQMLTTEASDGHPYRWVVENYFNKVVFENDLKWPHWEQGKSNTGSSFRREWIDRSFAWLMQRRIDVRGHFITWAPVDSNNGHGGGSLDTVRERLFAHMADEVPAVGNRVTEWDTINHISGWGNQTLEALYGPGIYVDIFNRSRALAPPEVTHWVNEGQIIAGGARRDDYERLIRHLIDNGQPPDGIGFMGHFGEGSLTPMTELYRTFDRFAALAPRIQITELDISTSDEQLQADYLRDVMIVAFSHPSFNGIVMWGFWEGRHWKPEAALFRRDWSAKPAMYAWLDLVFNRWWTNAQTATGEDGQSTLRAFLGEHEVEITAPGKQVKRSVTLPKEGASIEVVLQ